MEKRSKCILLFLLFWSVNNVVCFAQTKDEEKLVDNLPPYIERITQFGERAEWSHDGEKIIFVEKTYGDVYEIDVKTKQLRLVTGHFPHGGFVRALYLPNGDLLLSGSTVFNAEAPHLNREKRAEMFILDKSYTKPPTRMGTKVYDGPAVSRTDMKVAYSHIDVQYPNLLKPGQSKVRIADIKYDEDGTPLLVNKRVIFDNLNRGKPYNRKIEPQNFVPGENAITFTSYGDQPTEVLKLNIKTGKVSNMSKDPETYNEPEGIYPNGKFTNVESNDHDENAEKYDNLDIYKMKLDGSGHKERLTFFSDLESYGYEATNPVVSDEGRYMAFQLAKDSDNTSGVGHGIFIYDFEKARKYHQNIK